MELGQLSREEANKIIRRATGDTLPRQGDSLVLDRKGGFKFAPFALVPVTTITATHTVEGRDVCVLCDASGGAVTVNLPPAEYAEFRVLFIKKIDSSANNVVVSPNGSETIDGGSSVTLSSQWSFVAIVSDGSAWFKIG